MGTGDWFEEWCTTAFLLTGGVWLLSVISAWGHTRIDAVMGIHLGDIAQISVLVGILGTFICLLGLSPRLIDRTPRLVKGGLVFSGVSALGMLALLLVAAVGVTRPALLDIASVGAIGRGIAVFWAFGFVVYPLGMTLFGIAYLRSDDRSRTIGYLLAGPLVVWIVTGANHFIVGYNGFGPLGSNGIASVLVAVFFFAIGYLLHTESPDIRSNESPV